MEALKGGELFDRIIAKNHYTEAEARKLTITMLKAIKYLHEQGVAHRDLKPENILLKDTSEDAEIKITDFGLSKIFSSDLEGEVTMKTACGTPGYVAPEVLMHDVYSSQVDLWSVGVIVYILLCGFPPFYGDNDNQMFRKIKAGQYKFLSPYWDPISADAKEFVSKLLTVDWQKRMDAQQALDHRWLKDGKQASTHNLFEGNAMAMSRNTPPNPDSPKEVRPPRSLHLRIKSSPMLPGATRPPHRSAHPRPCSTNFPRKRPQHPSAGRGGANGGGGRGDEGHLCRLPARPAARPRHLKHQPAARDLWLAVRLGEARQVQVRVQRPGACSASRGDCGSVRGDCGSVQPPCDFPDARAHSLRAGGHLACDDLPPLLPRREGEENDDSIRRHHHRRHAGGCRPAARPPRPSPAPRHAAYAPTVPRPPATRRRRAG